MLPFSWAKNSPYMLSINKGSSPLFMFQYLKLGAMSAIETALS